MQHLIAIVCVIAMAQLSSAAQNSPKNMLLRDHCREILKCKPGGYMSSVCEEPTKCKYKAFNDQWDWSCLCSVQKDSDNKANCESRCKKLCDIVYPGARLTERTVLRATCGSTTHSCQCRALEPARTTFFSTRPGFGDRRKRLAVLDWWMN